VSKATDSVELKHISKYTEEVLSVTKIPDASLNGLQIANAGKIKKIACAVDFSLQSAMACHAVGADLLLVHHGMFWGKPVPLTGRMRTLVSYMLTHNIALMAQHLPLDVHAKYGNNALIAAALKWKVESAVASYRGVPILTIASPPKGKPVAWKTFLEDVTRQIGAPLSVLAFEKNTQRPVSRLGIVSGRGSSYLEEAITHGCDTFLTGDADHTLFHVARETGIRVLSCGHYATEIFGVKAFGRHLSEKFQIPFIFLDLPTQL
jgi:dinuclear metal center YbgI/SA1388 family protein